VLSVSEEENDDLRIDVKDTGIGMSETEIAKALEFFGQVRNTMSRQEGM
jgi:signal transduction histidine kinase